MSQKLQFSPKDPADVMWLDFVWSDDLQDDTIAAADAVFVEEPVDNALTVVGAIISIDAQTVRCQVSGGTIGATYVLASRIVTVGGDEFTRRASIQVKGGL